MRARIIAGFILCCVALVANAEEIDFWNFRGSMPKNALVNDLTRAEVTPEGILIQTQTEGYIGWSDQPLEGPVDVISLRIRSPRTIDAVFLWKPLDPTLEGMYQERFIIPASGDFASEIHISLGNLPNWDWRTQQIAFLFAPGTSIIIEEMNLHHWTPMEKLTEVWKSFWTFDTFEIYSINFLWGPLTTTNPVARAHLFDSLPPVALSALRIFYAILAASAVGGFIAGLYLRRKNMMLGAFAYAFIALWLLFDVRMGTEILLYAKRDINSFVMKEGTTQTLRSHGNLYAALQQALPIIRAHDRFALFEQAGSPYFNNIRYQSYPSVPVLENQPTDGIRLWAVFERRDMGVENARIWKKADTPSGREYISGTGSIVWRFDDRTFLFATDQ